MCPNFKENSWEKHPIWKCFVELIDKKWVMHAHTLKPFHFLLLLLFDWEVRVKFFWWVFSDDAIILNDKFYSWETNWNHFKKTREQAMGQLHQRGERERVEIEKNDNLTLWRLRCLNTLFLYTYIWPLQSARARESFHEMFERIQKHLKRSRCDREADMPWKRENEWAKNKLVRKKKVGQNLPTNKSA